VTPDIEDHNYKFLLSVSQEIKSTNIHICAPPSTNYVFIGACAALSELSMLYESTISCCKHTQLLFFCILMLQKRSKTFFTTSKETLHIAAYCMVPIISNAQGFIIIFIYEIC
jgi:TRAP-type C4-dicarboxylate transport system permease large subunit